MLFTSGLRKAVDAAAAYDPLQAAVNATAEETARLLAEKRKKQMIRRHTCSTLKPDASVSLSTRNVTFSITESVESSPAPCRHYRDKFSAPVSLAGSSYASSAAGLNKQPSAGSAQFDDWGSGSFAPPSHSSQPQPPAFAPPSHTLAQHAASSAPSLGGLPSQTTSNAGDDFDDEWTDEDEEQNVSSSAFMHIVGATHVT
ncbi:hypothetical protein WR25_25162 [Diploscapter pachys]|uniref:Uncharacterized protein n=1 Tax=Diploscapter pachys TaxID=2018661 RepID=A0A2A2LVQ6_9BILA|nr:hypothetical protein WR25_25162 [Diploscapter pachys]